MTIGYRFLHSRMYIFDGGRKLVWRKTDMHNPNEVIAYSLERNYVNRSNSFTEEIEKIIEERLEKI